MYLITKQYKSKKIQAIVRLIDMGHKHSLLHCRFKKILKFFLFDSMYAMYSSKDL